MLLEECGEMMYACVCCFFFKQKTAYEMRISDWSSDVCSSDLPAGSARGCPTPGGRRRVRLAKHALPAGVKRSDARNPGGVPAQQCGGRVAVCRPGERKSLAEHAAHRPKLARLHLGLDPLDRKSTRLNSRH